MDQSSKFNDLILSDSTLFDCEGCISIFNTLIDGIIHNKICLCIDTCVNFILSAGIRSDSCDMCSRFYHISCDDRRHCCSSSDNVVALITDSLYIVGRFDIETFFFKFRNKCICQFLCIAIYNNLLLSKHIWSHGQNGMCLCSCTADTDFCDVLRCQMLCTDKCCTGCTESCQPSFIQKNCLCHACLCVKDKIQTITCRKVLFCIFWETVEYLDYKTVIAFDITVFDIRVANRGIKVQITDWRYDCFFQRILFVSFFKLFNHQRDVFFDLSDLFECIDFHNNSFRNSTIICDEWFRFTVRFEKMQENTELI